MTTKIFQHRTLQQADPMDPGNPSKSTEVRAVDLGFVATELHTVLEEVRQRIADGETTPVLASHIDALGLRAIIQQLAEETDY